MPTSTLAIRLAMTSTSRYVMDGSPATTAILSRCSRAPRRTKSTPRMAGTISQTGRPASMCGGASPRTASAAPVPPTTRQQQRDQSRNHPPDTTVARRVEYGYAGTTTQRIQGRAGVSRGALLHHFGSKEQLFVAAIGHIAELHLEQIKAAAKQMTPGKHAVPGMVEALRK